MSQNNKKLNLPFIFLNLIYNYKNKTSLFKKAATKLKPIYVSHYVNRPLGDMPFFESLYKKQNKKKLKPIYISHYFYINYFFQK